MNPRPLTATQRKDAARRTYLQGMSTTDLSHFHKMLRVARRFQAHKVELETNPKTSTTSQ